jgi:hypothetical protein
MVWVRNIREISGGKSGAYLMANLNFWPMFGGENEKQRKESLPQRRFSHVVGSPTGDKGYL